MRRLPHEVDGERPGSQREGFVGGVLTATAVGTALWWATPFSPVAIFFHLTRFFY